MPKPISPELRNAITADIKTGKPRNQIARDHHVSGSTVTKIARETGDGATAFDRSQTEKAARAKRFDAALARVKLIERLYGVADRFLDRVEAEYTQVVSGPMGPELVTTKLPPLRDAQAGMSAAAIAMDKALKLEAVDSEDGAADAKSLLGQLGEALSVATHQFESETSRDSVGLPSGITHIGVSLVAWNTWRGNGTHLRVSGLLRPECWQ